MVCHSVKMQCVDPILVHITIQIKLSWRTSTDTQRGSCTAMSDLSLFIKNMEVRRYSFLPDLSHSARRWPSNAHSCGSLLSALDWLSLFHSRRPMPRDLQKVCHPIPPSSCRQHLHRVRASHLFHTGIIFIFTCDHSRRKCKTSLAFPFPSTSGYVCLLSLIFHRFGVDVLSAWQGDFWCDPTRVLSMVTSEIRQLVEQCTIYYPWHSLSSYALICLIPTSQKRN